MNASMPLISIVIPTYNHANFLKAAIDSVVAQTYRNWQAIIVNNFSDDNTIQIVSDFKDERISLINFSNDGVIAASRNEGIRNARGEFVAFLDSDDIWRPEKLARCVVALAAGSDIVCHGELWTGVDAPERVVMYGPRSRATYAKLLYRGNCISTSATIVRRSLLTRLNGFDERPEFVTAEDYDLWMRITRETTNISFVPEVLGEYRRHGGNASNAVIKNMSAELAVIEDHFSRQDRSFVRLCRQRHRRARAFYGAARALDSTGTRATSLKYFARSFATSPFVPRLYPAIALTVAHCVARRASRRTMTETRYFSIARHAMAEALRAIGIKSGDRVALPEFICRDLHASIHHLGAQVAYYPVDESLRPTRFPTESDVRAIIAVNYFGFAQQLEPFREYCRISNAVLIEDNAHGFLSADENGALLGTRAPFGITSIRKTIRIADGASLSINDQTYIDRVSPQLLPTSNKSLRPSIARKFSTVDRKFHLPIFRTMRTLARQMRKIKTGATLPISDPSSETEPLMIAAPYRSSLRILAQLNTEKEQARRRRLYKQVDIALADLPLRPVYTSLPTGTIPYGYPFLSDDRTAKLAEKITRGFGVEIIKWPDLPSAIEQGAPPHYKNIWLVNFL